jgi:hypothetical protein
MKVPTIATVRITILIASFAFVFTFIVVLLMGPGEFLLGLTVASDLSNASWVPNPGAWQPECRVLRIGRKVESNTVFCPVDDADATRTGLNSPSKNARV